VVLYDNLGINGVAVSMCHVYQCSEHSSSTGSLVPVMNTASDKFLLVVGAA